MTTYDPMPGLLYPAKLSREQRGKLRRALESRYGQGLAGIHISQLCNGYFRAYDPENGASVDACFVRFGAYGERLRVVREQEPRL